MANAAVPTLSVKGWVNSLAEKVDILIAQFFASDSSQSQLYPAGEIANLQVLIYNNTNNIPGLQQDLRAKLEAYLSRYFDGASVDVGNDFKTKGSGNVTMHIYAEVTQDKTTYVVANLLSIVDGKFEKITKINNTGQQ